MTNRTPRPLWPVLAPTLALLLALLASPTASEAGSQEVPERDGPTEVAQYDPMDRARSPSGSTAPSGDAGGAEETVATNPEFGDLPDTEGVEDTFYQCTACHSTAIIKQQRISDARWDYLWTWMIETQGMPDTDPETKAQILSYLKRHFSSEG